VRRECFGPAAGGRNPREVLRERDQLVRSHTAIFGEARADTLHGFAASAG
jgi:hypothetical protein